MAQYLSNELAGTTTGLTQASQVAAGVRPQASVYGGRLKRLRATITLASQTLADSIVVGILPAGATFAFGVYNSTVSLGGVASLSFGIASNSTKYAPSVAYTSSNTPTFFGTAAQAGLAAPLAAEEQVIASIGGTTLPASGTVVVDLYYSIPN